MKFLQEMIARKRQEPPTVQTAEEEAFPVDAPSTFDVPDFARTVAAARQMPEVGHDDHAPEETGEVGPGDDEIGDVSEAEQTVILHVLDDGSCDWDVPGAEELLDDADETVEADDPDSATLRAVVAAVPTPTPGEAPTTRDKLARLFEEEDALAEEEAEPLPDDDATGDEELDAFLARPQDGECEAAAPESGEFARGAATTADDADEATPQRVEMKRKIWDLMSEEPEVADEAPLRASDRPVPTRPVASATEDRSPAAAAPTASPASADPQRRRAGRVKTRLLGFHKVEEAAAPDPFSAPAPPAQPGLPTFPVGWLIVVDGPGRGASFELHAGASKIGRGEDQAIRLDFGDTAISRDNHAAVAYDDEQRRFYVGHGGKANLVRLNDMPVLSTETLSDGDFLRIGETSLRFVAFCGPEFSWSDESGEADVRHAAAE